MRHFRKKQQVVERIQGQRTLYLDGCVHLRWNRAVPLVQAQRQALVSSQRMESSCMYDNTQSSISSDMDRMTELEKIRCLSVEQVRREKRRRRGLETSCNDDRMWFVLGTGLVQWYPYIRLHK